MRAALTAAAVVLVVLDGLVSVRLLRSALMTPTQKSAWLCLIWLVPLVGAILGLHVVSDSHAPKRTDGALDAEEPLAPGLHVAGSGYVGGVQAEPPAGASFDRDS